VRGQSGYSEPKEVRRKRRQHLGVRVALTGSGLGPERVLGLLGAVVQDVDDDEGVPMAEQVGDGPVQRLLAARRVVHRHPDLAHPVAAGAGHHVKTLALAAAPLVVARQRWIGDVGRQRKNSIGREALR
jgi:hypothetical protein